MTSFIDISLTGDDAQVERMLDYLDERLSTVALAEWLGRDISHWLEARARDRFASEGDAASGPWLPLKDSTAEMRDAQGFPARHPINRRTGELEDLLTQDATALVAGADQAVLRFPGRVPRGELGEKLKTAQQGKPFPSTPARPVLAMDESDLEFVLLSLAAHIALDGVIS